MRTIRWRLWQRVLFAVSALALTGCGGLPQSILDPAGPVAETQLDLLSFDLKMVTSIGVVTIGLILYVIIKFRGRTGDDSLPPQVEGNRRLEIGWTLAAILVLLPLAIEPLSATFALERMPTGADVVNVKVVGHQWWWEFEYPDLGIVTANDLIIPAGKKVKLSVTSVDVIHSFWAPRIGGKMDAVPGRTNYLWLQGDEPGTYLGQCAELCGTSHANMKLQVIVKKATDWDAWVQGWKKPVAVDRLSPSAQQGWKLFNDKGCVGCHAIDGTAAQGKVGPNLTDLKSRTTLAAGMLKNTEEHLATWLRDPAVVKPRAQMPNLNLSPDEISALVQFLYHQP